ncbi:hypothetical protein RFI_26845, partial [Reticulomyxa filosa]
KTKLVMESFPFKSKAKDLFKHVINQSRVKHNTSYRPLVSHLKYRIEKFQRELDPPQGFVDLFFESILKQQLAFDIVQQWVLQNRFHQSHRCVVLFSQKMPAVHTVESSDGSGGGEIISDDNNDDNDHNNDNYNNDNHNNDDHNNDDNDNNDDIYTTKAKVKVKVKVK